MKIIRPVDVGSGDFESSAPGDGYVHWQTVGRNFLTSTADLLIACNQVTLFAVDEAPSFSKTLHAFDLDTGAESALAFTLSNFDIKSMAASPDGQYLALGGYKNGSYSSSNAEIRVYNLSTGTTVFSRQARVFEGISWSPDSGMLAFSGNSTAQPKLNTTVLVVAPGAWGTVGSIDNVDSIYLEPFPDGSRSASWGYGFGGFVAGPDGAYYSLFTYQSYVLGDAPNDFRYHIRKSILGRLTPASSNSHVTRSSEGPTTNPTFGTYPTPSLLTYNPVKSHILGYMEGGFYAFSEATLAEDADVPSMPGITQQSISPSLDGLEFVTTNDSVQPYLRKFSSTSYTQTGSLDSEVGGFTDNIRYSADYIVFGAPEGGYGLIESLTGDRITQVNPTVTKGDKYTYAQSNFEALTDNNDRPDQGAVADPPTWLNLGAINPLRMFDGKLDTLTTAPSPLTVNITPGQLANGIALFNVTAQTVQITMTDPDEGLVYDSGEFQMLDNASIRDWYGFFFEPYLRKADAARINLPPYPDATITVTLSADGDSVSIGQLVLGTIQRFGDTVYGTSVGITDFSRKEADVFGNYQIVERRFSKRAEYDVSIDTRAVASVQRTLAAYRAKPVVWVGAVEQEETIVYGYYRDFDIVIDNFSTSDATITVEGL